MRINTAPPTDPDHYTGLEIGLCECARRQRLRGELLQQRVHHVLEAACPCMHHIPLRPAGVLRGDMVPQPGNERDGMSGLQLDMVCSGAMQRKG